MLEEVKEFHSSQPHHPNHHHQFERDQYIATHVERIEGKVFVLAVDKNQELILNLFPYATQKLVSPETQTRAHQANVTAAWLLHMERPDDKRHAFNKDHHLPSHPEHDIYQSEQPHSAVARLWHFGFHHETGHPQKMSLQLDDKDKYRESGSDEHGWKQFKDNWENRVMEVPT